MNFEDLKKKHLVVRDEHFMPVVFVDMGAMLCGVLVGTTANKIGQKIDNSVGVVPVCRGMGVYTSIVEDKSVKQLLLVSSDDICY